jgi:hypothetical protein
MTVPWLAYNLYMPFAFSSEVLENKVVHTRLPHQDSRLL